MYTREQLIEAAVAGVEFSNSNGWTLKYDSLDDLITGEFPIDNESESEDRLISKLLVQRKIDLENMIKELIPYIPRDTHSQVKSVNKAFALLKKKL